MSKKVLVVEDDAFLLKVFAAHLERIGIEPVCITDGALAVEAAVRSKPRLILLDIGLPHKNGFQILEQLKKKKQTKNIPVFLVTKLGDEDDRELGLKLGATKYFYKAASSFPEILKEATTFLNGSE